MARFMIFGSVGWDHPIWLDSALSSGARILGYAGDESGSNLPQGRLGGGGANSAACLRNANHEVAIWSATGTDGPGEQMREALATLSIDCTYLQEAEPREGVTLILIEPDGERTIIFQHANRDINQTARQLRKRQQARIDLAKIKAHHPDGLYLRSLYAGYEDLHDLEEAWCVAHWPQICGAGTLPADILIGSRDDLAAARLLEDTFAKGQTACGGRLKWAIVTDGASGGEIISETQQFRYASLEVEQVDATGAGDAFAAGVLEALTAGADIVEATRHGAVWGSVTVGLEGCAQVRATNTYPAWKAGQTESA